MKRLTFLIPTLLALSIVLSCNETYQFSIKIPKKSLFENEINATLIEKNNLPIDSVQFFINNKRAASTGSSILINSTKLGVGKHTISSLIFYPGKTKKINNSFEIFPAKSPDLYTYKIVNEYPHDASAYTQGLEYYKGFLYESTGKKGLSTLRKVDIKSGKILQKVSIDKQFFGEGMTIFNDKIFLLTWQAKKGFVYDLKTFQKEKEFLYKRSKEGWGFTHNKSELIKSDGSHKIWFLDPNTQQEKRAIQVYYPKGKIGLLNELEWFNGKLLANRWITEKPIKSIIVMINPENGIVEGLIDLAGLRKKVLETQLLADDMVLNGIAYDHENKRLFVTGKNWGKLFEIELIKK